jgi:hypothetical protein
MKALPLLLAASLVANAALVTVTLRRSDSSADSSLASRSSSSATAGAASASAKSKTDAPADIVSALKANDPEALRDLLRAAGLPDETVRNLVGTAIWSRYRDRMKALQPKPDPDKPWWKNDQHNNWFGGMTREQRAEMRRLQAEAQDESTRILGPTKDNNGWGWQDNRLSFLPEEKRKDFREIEQDYQDLIQEVQQEMNGFTLPSDTEKIRFLQEEQKRDLAAILTPAELADYELRMSKTANQLRWKMTRFDGTEEEYRKVFAIQKAFDDTQQTDAYGNPVNQGPDDWKKRQEAQKLLNAQIKEALGADRYAEYSRSQNHEYQQLQSAAKRLDLPPETAVTVFNLRNDIASESKLIAENENLAPDQKKQALADLAKKTRAQVVSALGEEAAGVYMKGSMHWLNSVEQGQLVTFSEDGQFTGSRQMPTPKKTTAK